MTADELLMLPDDGMRHELVDGELFTMMAPGFEHGRVAGKVFKLLAVHVDETHSGETLAAETGFVLARDPDTVRAPDVAFVSRERFEAIGSTVKYWPEAPDFVAEVLSPSDSFAEVQAKAMSWLDAGTKAVLVVDPGRHTATVYWRRDGVRVCVYRGEDQIDLEDAVPGWRVALAELFA